MAITELPLYGDSTSFTYTITLDGVAYRFGFDYAERHDAWYLSIYTPDGEALRTGRRITCGYPLNLKAIGAQLPAGVLIAVRLDDGGDAPPSIDDLGGAIALLRITSESLPPDAPERFPLAVEEVTP